MLAVCVPLVYLADLGTQSLALRERAQKGLKCSSLETMYVQRLFSAVMTAVTGVAAVVAVVGDWLPWWVVLLPVMLMMEKEATGLLGLALSDDRSMVQLVSLPAWRGASLTLFIAGAHFQPVSAIAAYTISCTVTALVTWLVLYQPAVRYIKPAGWATVKPRIRAGLAFWAASLSHQVRTLDVSLVALWSSPAQAGYYALVSRASGPIRLASTSLSSVALPSAARRDFDELHRLNRVVIALTIAAAITLGAVVAFADDIIIFLVGDAYLSAAWPLRVLCLGLIFNVPGSYLSGLLQGIGYQRFVGKVGIVLALTTVAMVSLGAVLADAVGAAAALSAVYLIQFCIMLIVAQRKVFGIGTAR